MRKSLPEFSHFLADLEVVAIRLVIFVSALLCLWRYFKWLIHS